MGFEDVEHDQRRPWLALDVPARAGEPIRYGAIAAFHPSAASDLKCLAPHDGDPLIKVARGAPGASQQGVVLHPSIELVPASDTP